MSDCKVCAGIVTFNPDIDRLRKCITSVKNQVEKVYIVDNDSENYADILELISKYITVKIIKNDRNCGLSIALNQLCRVGVENGYSWILTLDQDTIICNNLIEMYCQIEMANVGVVTCKAVFNKEVPKKKKLNFAVHDVERCITGGSLVKLEVWKEIGGFDEKLFIEWIDYDFCMALRINGYGIKQIDVEGIFQVGGEVKKRTLHGHQFEFSSYSALRRYYQARNCIYYMRKWRGCGVDYIWILRNIWFGFKVILLFESPKKQKLLSYTKGLYDGCKL